MTDSHYDVIVVGLGIMGSSTLYQLSKRGVKVLGIDRFNPPHDMASSHGDTRITRQAVGEGTAYVPFVLRSNEIWRELEEESGEKLYLKTGGFIIEPSGGGAEFHAHSDFVGRTAKIAEANDIEHEVMDADAIKEWLPMLKLQPHEQGYYEPGSGVLRPEKCIKVQLKLAQEQGAEVHTGEKASFYMSRRGSGVLVETDKGEYTADKLIVTVGPWLLDYLEPALRDYVKIYRQVIYWFEAENPDAFSAENFPFVIWIGNKQEDFFTVFPSPLKNGVPGVKLLTEQYAEDTHPDLLDRTVTQQEIEHMYHYYVKERVAGIKNNCLHTGVCMYTVTPDENFIIDFHPMNKNVILASPCSGHGFKHAAAIGEALCQMALDGKSELDVKPFSVSRF